MEHDAARNGAKQSAADLGVPVPHGDEDCVARVLPHLVTWTGRSAASACLTRLGPVAPASSAPATAATVARPGRASTRGVASTGTSPLPRARAWTAFPAMVDPGVADEQTTMMSAKASSNQDSTTTPAAFVAPAQLAILVGPGMGAGPAGGQARQRGSRRRCRHGRQQPSSRRLAGPAAPPAARRPPRWPPSISGLLAAIDRAGPARPSSDATRAATCASASVRRQRGVTG
jgi:hypothetical protein